ncbi:hypothetical protein SAMN04515625_0028 [Methanohalophilus halophilus]|uniref:Uncharacterized protein n=1 Tax=Methanohalophilus halophilus TaxID=2177 RepID=A0A1H2PY79_9EURY|nr:hypothetical protein SAMN04515625_0028 [Methanohalophilus halophilus]
MDAKVRPVSNCTIGNNIFDMNGNTLIGPLIY